MVEDIRVLVTYASERGSTAEIADAIGDALRAAGVAADVRPTREAQDLSPYRAVVMGSALYMMRWRPEAVRFLKLRRRELAERTVWLFQSGPLDDSADTTEIALPRKVGALAASIGIRGHVTFGGRLDAGAAGFIASRMAKTAAGDFRNFPRIRAWATAIAGEIRASAAVERRGATPGTH